MTPEQLWARLKPRKDEIERLLEERGEYVSLFGLTEEEAREFNEMFEESARRFREKHSHLEVEMVEIPIGERHHRVPVFSPRLVLKEKDHSPPLVHLADKNDLTTGTVFTQPSAMGKSVDQTKRLADVLEECRVLDEAHHFDTHHYQEPPPAEADEVSSGKRKPKMTNRYGSPFDFKPRKGKRIK